MREVELVGLLDGGHVELDAEARLLRHLHMAAQHGLQRVGTALERDVVQLRAGHPQELFHAHVRGAADA